jgi:hypothetical protein
MRKTFVLFFLSSLQIFAQKPIFQKPLSERIANYDIDVKLDVEKKTLDGKQTLTWKNTSKDLVSELQFHLYLNAFKDENSTFMKESDGKLRNNEMEKQEKENYGWINLTSIKVRDGENLFNPMI